MLTTGFFAALKGPAKDQLLCLFVHGTYRKRQVLFQEGNPAARVFAIKSGLVKLYQTSSDGSLQLIQLVRPGEIFGLEGLTNGQYSVTAEVVTEAELCFFENDRFVAVMKANPALSYEIIRILTGNLQDCRGKMLGFGTKTAAARLASFLMSLLPAGAGPSAVIELPLSRGEVSDLIGTRLETVSRLLASMKRRRILSVRGHRIKVLDVPRLKASAA